LVSISCHCICSSVGKGKKGAGASAFPDWAFTALEKIRRNKNSLMVVGYMFSIFA
jgi:hypothetical protein